MRFNYNGADFLIEFSYSNSVKNQKDFNRRKLENPNVKVQIVPDQTTCSILKGAPGTHAKDMSLVSSGTATRHLVDKFEKNNGRVLALTRALAQTCAHREFRTIAWECYNGRTIPSEVKQFLTLSRKMIKSNPVVKAKLEALLAV